MAGKRKARLDLGNHLHIALCNRRPIGVYSSKELAEFAIDKYERNLLKRMSTIPISGTWSRGYKIVPVTLNGEPYTLVN